jgi:hypothetical protein
MILIACTLTHHHHITITTHQYPRAAAVRVISQPPEGKVRVSFDPAIELVARHASCPFPQANTLHFYLSIYLFI